MKQIPDRPRRDGQNICARAQPLVHLALGFIFFLPMPFNGRVS